MLVAIIDILRIFQLAIVILGTIIGYYGSKSYFKTKQRSMLFLAVGFAFVTVGAVAAGVLFELLKFDLITVETVASGFEVFGFSLIVYSIVGMRD
jgi:hypothetical protein